MNLYREFNTQEQIDREYNALLMVPDLQPYLDHDAKLNNETIEQLDCILDLRYGPSVDETVDIFPAANPDSPIVIFIHGGYWRSLSSRDFNLVARGLVSNGMMVALPNYSLCPKVSIPEITRQMRGFVVWIYHNALKHNGDKNRIFVCGHSAGAQQVGMLAATSWTKEYDLPMNVLKGGIPISGIFDLSPLYYSWLQPTLQLTYQTILRESPHFQIPKIGPPLLISAGEMESNEFIRQSTDYLSAWQKNGLDAELLIQPDRNHFTTFRDLTFRDSQLCKAVTRFISTDSS